MRVFLFICYCLIVAPLMADEFHDPMKPPAVALNKFRIEKIKNTAPVANNSATAEKTAPWVLNSILFSGVRQHAIINNKLVRKGEVIGGAKLVSLQKDRVRLVARGRVIDLKLPGRGQSIKKSLDEKKL